MRTKAIFIIGIVFIIKFLISCNSFFNHPCEKDTYEGFYSKNFSSIEKMDCDELDFQDDFDGYECNLENVLVFNPKEEVGLRINIDFDVLLEPRPEGFSFNFTQFNSLYAEELCDDIIVYKDAITSIKFYAIDLVLNSTNDITSKIRYKGFYDETTEILDSIDDYESMPDYFDEKMRFSIVDFDNIPDSTFFRTETVLESGTVLTSETQTVVFRDSTSVNFEF